MYEVVKDALKVAQKADNIELVQKLFDIQKQALDMQEKQQALNQTINELTSEISELKEAKKYVFAEGRNYLIDPGTPTRKLCPFCTQKHRIAVPLDRGRNCQQCKCHYN